MLDSENQRLLSLVRTAREQLLAQEEALSEPLAIIGVGGRFPGADNTDEFWQNLAEGRCTTSYRSEKGGIGGFLRENYEFDPEFFNISPRECEYLDPQQRLILEVAHETLESAGYAAKKRLPSNAAVVVGISSSDYATLTLANSDVASSPYSITGTSTNAAAGRLSFLLGIHGPSLAVDTACSSSLVAVHLAGHLLRSKETDLVIVGGVNVILQEHAQRALAQTNVISASGRCRPFDAGADGMLRGEGCGVIILKRFKDALRDQDKIRALVRGSWSNQDGASSGLTTPNGLAQKALLQRALANARLTANDIDYVEAHGTGTRLGDPVELHAIAEVFEARERPLYVTSVKANVGHLEAASGITGIIKTVLALEHELIPRQVHFESANPDGPVGPSALQVPRENQPWARTARPRRAGVSSFGFSGTNAHVVLEEAPARPSTEPGSPEQRCAVFLSAKSENARRELAQRYIEKLSRPGCDLALADVAYTSLCRREHHDFRLAVVANDRADLLAKLRVREEDATLAGPYFGSPARSAPSIAFLFSGQGSQYEGMGRALYDREPLFRGFLDEAAQSFAAETGQSLLDICWTKTGQLDQTRFVQPALFSLQYALGRFWMALGVRPTSMVGHSVGEYAAACLSGVFELPVAMKLICARAAHMAALPSNGAMLAVTTSKERLTPLLARFPKLALAAHNAPNQCVVAGDATELERLRTSLATADVIAIPLRVSHAFHSPLMEPAYAPFLRTASNCSFGTPSVRLISTLADDYPESARFVTAEYWARQIVGGVDYVGALGALERSKVQLCLEIGASATAIGLARQCFRDAKSVGLCASLNQRDQDAYQEALARLYAIGCELDGERLFSGKPQRMVSLPTYPFQRKVYRAQPSSETRTPRPSLIAHAFGRKWLPYREPIHSATERSASACLILGADEISRTRLAELLRPHYASVHTASDLGDLRAQQRVCVVFIAAPPVTEESGAWASFQATSQELLQAIQLSIGPLVDQVQAFLLLTVRAHDVGSGGNADGALLGAPLWQLVSGLRREHPSLNARCLDLPALPRSPADLEPVLCAARLPDLVFRSGSYYSQALCATTLASQEPALDAFAQGSYVVTGASGDIGKSLVEWLAQRGARRIIALSRAGMPATASNALAEAHPHVELTNRQVDVCSFAELRQTFDELVATGHVIRGIFHLAAHIDDAPLAQQDWRRARSVLDPKALGAFHLHLLSRALPVQHFVLFSSACTFLGSTGQAIYALANEFLNQLALQRVREGLPALSVAWGAWEGSHAVSSVAVRKNLALAGIAPRPARAALADLGVLMLQSAPCLGSFDVDWSKFVPGLSAYERREPYFAEFTAEVDSAPAVASTPRDVRATVIACLSSVLGVTAETLHKTQRTLFQLGMDSMTAVELRDRLNRELGTSLPIGFAYSYKTLEEIVEYLGLPTAATAKPSLPLESSTGRHDDVAVVGLSCNFPGAIRTPDEFWNSLWHGENNVERIERAHWLADLADFPDVPDEIRFSGLVRSYAEFDPEFFQITPREAKYIDPQHRLLLLAAWEALESGNHAHGRTSRERAGIFVGTGSNEFGQLLSRQPRDIGAHFGTGNAPSILAGRIAYFLDWHGPAITIDTACSSALVAIHQACEAIRRGECELALAGGVNLQLIPATSLFLAQIEALSKTGRCRAFSADADGYVRAEGCGMVLLKPLRQALADGDHIHAVVCGSSINQDGRTQGITAPNGKAQAAVIEAALRNAQLDPNRVGYVEAHGTGTPLGDPIEMESINQVYARQRPSHQPLRVGSVKANIGHTESAAGIASFIKAALMLEHRAIPLQLYSESPNSRLNLLNEAGEQVIFMPPQSEAWQAEEGERVAGVSSFGFSGTNVHLLLREAPPRSTRTKPPAQPRQHTFVLSAHTDDALRSLAAKYRRHLSDRPQDSIRDICHTAACHRSHFERRLALECRDTPDLVAQLGTFLSTHTSSSRTSSDGARPLLVLTGALVGPALTTYLAGLSAIPQLRAAHEVAAREILELSLADLERRSAEQSLPAAFGAVLELVLVRFLQRAISDVALLAESATHSLLRGDSASTLADSPALRALRESLLSHPTPISIVGREELNQEQTVLLSCDSGTSLPAGPRRIDAFEAQSLQRLSGELYLCGFDVDFALFSDGVDEHKVILPTYAFEQRSYLPEQLQAAHGPWDWATAPERSEQGSLAFTLEFSAHSPYPLRHHVLHGQIVVPGAFYLSLVSEIAQRHFGAQRVTLIDITFPQAQILDERERYAVRFVLREIRAQVHDVEVQTQLAGSSRWQVAAHLTLSVDAGAALETRVEWSSAPPNLTVRDFYQTLSRNGARLGRAFQCLRSIRRADEIAYCELEPDFGRELLVSPGLFDSLFQTMGLCLPGSERDCHDVRVPYSIGRVQIDACELGACRARTRLRRVIEAVEGQQVLVHDILVFDHDQRPRLSIEDFATLSYTRPAASARETSACDTYTWQWRGAELPHIEVPRKSGPILVYCPPAFNSPSFSEAVQLELSRSGISCSTSLSSCLQALNQSPAESSEKTLWLLYTLAHERYDAEWLELLSRELFELKRAILADDAPPRVAFHFASHRSLSTSSEEAVHNLAGHVLLGFLKTMSVECQRPSWAWHDWPDADPREIAARLQERRAVGTERLLAHRATQIRVPRLMRHAFTEPARFAVGAGTCVITGASGGVARELICALRDRGCRNFALLSRSIRGDALADLFEQRPDLTVVRRALDVADSAAVQRVLAEIEASMPPITAIFHTAGVLRDGGMSAQTERAFQEVLSAKAIGAWNLHQATVARPHVRLVFLSSVGAVFGAVGQGIYAGANHFLHGLTALRTAHGLPTTCIASGGWAGVGMQAAQSGVAQKSGLSNSSSAEMLEGIFACMSSEESDFAVMNADWQRLGTLFARAASTPAEFSVLLPLDSAQGSERASRVDEVLSIPKAARVSHVIKLLAEEIAPLMELDSDRLASGKSLRSLGLESITALQIRQLVNQRFELQAPATVLFEVTNLRDLAVYVCAELEQKARPLQTDAPPTMANASQLDATNEEDLLAILTDLVGT